MATNESPQCAENNNQNDSGEISQDPSSVAEDRRLAVDELVEVFYQPSYKEILNTLEKLKVQPSSWGSRLANRPLMEQEKKKITRYLVDLIKNDLIWFDSEEQREQIYSVASECLNQRVGRSGAPGMTRTWKLWDAVDLVIHEPPLTGDNLGLKTWCSSYALAKRLETIAKDHPLKVDAERRFQVLELGSGTGLVGFAAAALWRCSVLLTDLPEIVPNLKRNQSANMELIMYRGGSTKVDVLDWDTIPNVAMTRGLCQFIIAADPLYSPEHANMLARVIDVYLNKDSDARVVVELPLRDQATRNMAQTLRIKLDERDFDLIQQGEETAYDDFEDSNGDSGVTCWWGIWSRRYPCHLVSGRWSPCPRKAVENIMNVQPKSYNGHFHSAYQS